MTKTKKSRQRALVIIAGEGGHMAQALRLLSHIDSDNQAALKTVLITDHPFEGGEHFHDVCAVRTCAPKHRSVQLGDISGYSVDMIKTCWYLRRTYDVRITFVTGPGFAFFPALFLKCLRAKLIVFESWSRFQNRSKCSQVLYPLADEFWVQHKEVLKLYPKATWVGLL